MDIATAIDLGVIGIAFVAGGMASYAVRARGARQSASPDDAREGRLENRILESAIESVVVFSDDGMHAEWANAAARALLGYEIGELHRISFATLCAPPSRKRAAEAVRQAVADGKVELEDVELLRKNGSSFPASITLRELRGSSCSGLIANFRDISEQKASYKQLLQTAKQATIGQLVGGVAHELSNPLGAIRLHAELIGSSLQLSQEEARAEIGASVRVLDQCVDRMQRIISGLRRIAQPAAGGMRDADLNELVEQAVSLFSKRFREDNISLRLELCDSLPRVLTDGQQMEQALISILANAADAARGASERRIRIRTEGRGAGVACTIENTGASAPSVDADRALGPVFVAKGAGYGPGLRLSLAHSIVQDHHGRTYLKNLEGGGAAVTFWLPSPGMQDS